ncbi:hypothetical protein JNUCC42_22480 [Brevibacterium sp. JNUCC-42]|nr:hypothetical protein JNUCC42_22480 [Brevibacterium sp. JNUCC-42]
MHSWIRPVALLGLSGILLLPGSIVEATTKSKLTQRDVQLIAQNVSTSKLTKEQALSIASEFVR